MSIFHVQSQLMLYQWLSTTDPAAKVELEGWTAGRKRRADVLATSASGVAVAFEIQYSAEQIWRWQERHDSYAEHNIRDVWLFGNKWPHFKPLTVPDVALMLSLTDLQRTALDAGVVPRLAEPAGRDRSDPVRRTSDCEPRRRLADLPTGDDRRVQVVVELLAGDCELDATHGLMTPSLRELLLGRTHITTPSWRKKPDNVGKRPLLTSV